MRVEEIVGRVIEFPFFIFVMLVLSRRRFSDKTTLLAVAALAALYMLVSYVFLFNWYGVIYAHPALDLAYRTAHILLMALAALCLTRQRFVQSLYIMASAYVTITVIDVLAVACRMAAGLPEFAAKCLLYLIICLLIYRARKPFTGILNQTKKGWWLLCSVPLFLIVNFLLLSALPVSLSHNPSALIGALILCGTTVIIYITFFYMMWQLYKQSQLEQNVMALRLSVTALENRNELIRRGEEQFAVFKHDLRHITRMLSDCLERGDWDSVKELLARLDENADSVLTIPARDYTGNQLLDAVLGFYLEQAREWHIEVATHTEPTDRIPADMTELAVVLANALENAVNACRLMPEDAPRVIRLDGRRRGAQYFVEIANTFLPDTVIIDSETGLPRSHPSESGDGHGLGCQSIAYFARKYNAPLQFQIENGWFHMRMLL